MALQLVTAPAAIFDTAIAKAHLRVDASDEDTLIDAMAAAAVDAVQQYTGLALKDQTYDFYLDEFPSDGSPIQLPKPPLIEVVGLYYLDSGGVEQEWDAANYIVDSASRKARIALPSSGSWPTAATRINAVRIRFRAGFLDQSVSPAEANVPAGLIAAVKLVMSNLFENREANVIGVSVSELPMGAKYLMDFYRVETGMA